MSSYTSISDQLPGTRLATYLGSILATLLVILVGTSAVNAWIDPLDQLGHNRIGIYADFEREAKAAQLPRGDHAGVILGSSKTSYIDPEELDMPGIFNASFALAMPEELLAFARTFIRPGQTVLIGLDLYMFNEHAFPLLDAQFEAEPGLGARLGYLVSGSTLLHSIGGSLQHLWGQPPRLGPMGNVLATNRLQRHEAMSAPEPAPVLDMLSTVHFDDFAFSEQRLAILDELKSFLEVNGNPYIVFINPLSEPVLAHLATLDVMPHLERLRDELHDRFGDLVDLTDSDWSAVDNFLYFDVYHYLPRTGNAFTNQEILPRLTGPRLTGNAPGS